MNNLLKLISDKAYRLKMLNMKQVAADFDFLVAWLKSSEYNSKLQVNNHVPPNPAGADTIDSHSNNCPIPFTVSGELISGCRDSDDAIFTLTELDLLIDEIIAADQDEVVAIAKYKEYIAALLSLL